MDDRQQQIREGAGLEESRLNTEFIDFLKKYSTPVLVVIALIAIGFFAWNKYAESREQALAAAFTELEAAADAGKPENLLAVAEDHAGEASIAELARLYAADFYLNSVRSGLRIGAPLDPQGLPTSEEDILDEKGIEDYLSKAQVIYDAVVNRSNGKPDQIQFTVGGLFGLAAIAESRGKIDEAKAFYERVKTTSGESNPEFVSLAQHRIDTLGQLAALPKLYRQAELPQPKPAETPMNLIPMEGPPPGLEVTPAPGGPAGPPTLTPIPAPQPLPQPSQDPATQPANLPAPAPVTPPAPSSPPAPAAEPPADAPKPPPGN